MHSVDFVQKLKLLYVYYTQNRIFQAFFASVVVIVAYSS